MGVKCVKEGAILSVQVVAVLQMELHTVERGAIAHLQILQSCPPPPPPTLPFHSFLSSLSLPSPFPAGACSSAPLLPHCGGWGGGERRGVDAPVSPFCLAFARLHSQPHFVWPLPVCIHLASAYPLPFSFSLSPPPFLSPISSLLLFASALPPLQPSPLLASFSVLPSLVSKLPHAAFSSPLFLPSPHLLSSFSALLSHPPLPFSQRGASLPRASLPSS
mmetsp:Transcript_6808/g.17117  ORF Transcript_6808/g.17117 Transcript_6808/m.17117 type:complete len:219 (-) Transcript_6808:997-1653(-)